MNLKDSLKRKSKSTDRKPRPNDFKSYSTTRRSGGVKVRGRVK